jgi:hypothetical protein
VENENVVVEETVVEDEGMTFEEILGLEGFEDFLAERGILRREKFMESGEVILKSEHDKQLRREQATVLLLRKGVTAPDLVLPHLSLENDLENEVNTVLEKYGNLILGNAPKTVKKIVVKPKEVAKQVEEKVDINSLTPLEKAKLYQKMKQGGRY